jgi:hypothetical protein
MTVHQSISLNFVPGWKNALAPSRLCDAHREKYLYNFSLLDAFFEVHSRPATETCDALHGCHRLPYDISNFGETLHY